MKTASIQDIWQEINNSQTSPIRLLKRWSDNIILRPKSSWAKLISMPSQQKWGNRHWLENTDFFFLSGGHTQPSRRFWNKLTNFNLNSPLVHSRKKDELFGRGRSAEEREAAQGWPVYRDRVTPISAKLSHSAVPAIAGTVLGSPHY